MSQIFNLRLATETIVIDAQQLGVTIEQLQRIRVEVSATIIQQPEPHLWLTYKIALPHSSLAAQLNWPVWQQAQVGFNDYLWEQTCLECFISGNDMNINTTNIEDTNSYIEINASPSGRYALYQFNSYRNPSTLPPTPLLKVDGKTRAHIEWADSSSKQTRLHIAKLSPLTTLPLTNIITALSTSTFTPCRYYEYEHSFYERSFSVPLTQLSNPLSSIHAATIERLHPCIILWFGEIALYFAPIHASPPDFHQRCYWSAFDHKTALTE